MTHARIKTFDKKAQTFTKMCFKILFFFKEKKRTSQCKLLNTRKFPKVSEFREGTTGPRSALIKILVI